MMQTNRALSPRLHRFCSSIKLHELQQADSLQKVGRFPEAASLFHHSLQILKSAQQENSGLYQLVKMKLTACQFLARNYSAICQITDDLEFTDRHPQSYTEFLYLGRCSSELLAKGSSTAAQHPIAHSILSFTQRLLASRTPSLKPDSQPIRYPVLNCISRHLNNSYDYRKALISLTQRKMKQSSDPTEQTAVSEISQPISSPPAVPPQLQILYFMGWTLSGLLDSEETKRFCNQRLEAILKTYESSQPHLVYAPLTAIALNLIAQQHYMSAEGIIGHIKSGESGLFQAGTPSTSTQFVILVNNLYRMLVTRAHDQPYELGWAKEKEVHFGQLVLDETMKAALETQNYGTVPEILY